MAKANGARGMIAVDKMGTKVLFLDPVSYQTEIVLEDFPRTVHELLVVPETALAYVPIFGDGIHGRNPIPAIFTFPKHTHKKWTAAQSVMYITDSPGPTGAQLANQQG